MKRAGKSHSHLLRLSPLNHNIIDQILWDRGRVVGRVVSSSPVTSSSASGTAGALICGFGVAGVPSCRPDSSSSSTAMLLTAATFTGLLATSAALSFDAFPCSRSSLAFSCLQAFSSSCRNRSDSFGG